MKSKPSWIGLLVVSIATCLSANPAFAQCRSCLSRGSQVCNSGCNSCVQQQPCPCPSATTHDAQPQPQPAAEPSTDQTADAPMLTPPDLAFNTRDVAFSGNTFAAFDSKAGYIDSAIIRSQVRFRFEAGYDINRADRAEFMYTTWRAFGGKNPNPPVGFPDPHIDQQSLKLYFEHAVNNCFSLFAEGGVVFSDPLRNPNDQGFGDMEVGFKVSLLHDACQQLTFQLKNYIPTADAGEHWVGTGHYSIEPGILFYRQLNSRWSMESEIRDWIAIGGADDYAGNVLRWGLGLGYDMGCVGGYQVKPIVEVVGWHVLDGQVFDFNDSQVDFTNANLSAGDLGPRDASGDAIVNIKIGTRITNCCGGSLYAGYGNALTSDRWYEDVFRIELRRMF